MSYHCKVCNYNTFIKCNYEKHILTKKHKNNQIINTENINTLKNLFICEKCNKQLSTKYRYNNHISICKGVSSNLECYKCNKIFNNRITRYIHEKKCNISQIIPYEAPINNITTNNNITNITNNNITNNVNIVVNNFGNENLDYFIEHPDFITFMNNCIENKTDGVCNLIVKKHFDPDHKENHNIRKLNKKDNFLEIYENKKWCLRNYKDGLDYVTIPLEYTVSIFMEKLLEQNKTIKKSTIQHFMQDFGSIIGWDLSVGNYDFSYNNADMHNNNLSEKSKRVLKTQIYKKISDCIFECTKLVHKNK